MVETSRQGDDVVDLAHVAFDFQPVRDIAAVRVDDLQAALCVRIAACQFVVERQAAEGFVMPGLRKAADGLVVGEGQSAQVAWTE